VVVFDFDDPVDSFQRDFFWLASENRRAGIKRENTKTASTEKVHTHTDVYFFPFRPCWARNPDVFFGVFASPFF